MTEGLFGYWPLNEGTGTQVRDLTGKHAPGVIRQNDGGKPLGLGADGGVWVTDSQRGVVLGLSGENTQAYVFLGAEVIPVMDLANGFTWAFWSKSDQTSNSDIILGNRYMTNNTDFSPREFIKFANSRFEWQFDGTDHHLDYSNIGVQTEWMHHAVVKNGDMLTYFRDGVETLTRFIDGAPANKQPLYIAGQGIENWRGYIEEVALWNRALSPEDITQLHELGLSGGSLANMLNPAPKISVARTATGISLTFEGTLEQADEVTGPYASVTGAASPYRITASAARKFFRARR
ncbi:MAG: LamG domain-containing protein [Verrucomicrobia bacterium]|nr:LamG domain-containing protein [Verrucomicrobiota bacterium]